MFIWITSGILGTIAIFSLAHYAKKHPPKNDSVFYLDNKPLSFPAELFKTLFLVLLGYITLLLSVALWAMYLNRR